MAMRKYRIFRQIFAGLLLAWLGGLSQAGTVSFSPSGQDFPNPERGFWYFIADDFADMAQEDANWVRDQGARVGYAMVLLKDYRNRPLPPQFLARLERSFGMARRAGIKLILRFAYNYYDFPDGDYEQAEDAPLEIVLAHISQLGPLINQNADLIALWQVGFIGAWGEGHSSSNGLDQPARARQIADAVRDVAPDNVFLAWRYPANLMAWATENNPMPRLGLHNDCFLSSQTDVGTYSENRKARRAERRFVANRSATTPFTAETCDATRSGARTSCAAILSEGAKFHLSLLNRAYDQRFHEGWARQGCFDQVARSLGYRLELVSAQAPDTITTQATIQAEISIRNTGWARLHRPRPLLLIARHKGSNTEYRFEGGSLGAVEPGRMARFSFALQLPGNAPRGRYDLFVAAPDPSPRLADDPAFAIRFANENNAGAGQEWNQRNARFSLGLPIWLE